MGLDFQPSDFDPPQHLSIDDPHQLALWSTRLGVSPDHLREAVDRVGTALYAVEQYLGCSASASS